MKLTIHQPEHAPWLGLLDKISKCDTFVILDTVQFRKNYFQNRNKIGTEENPTWITVPVAKHPLATKIKDIEISDYDWRTSYLGKVNEIYHNAPYFEQYYPKLFEIMVGDYKYLGDLNYDIIRWMMNKFNIKTTVIKSSDMQLPEVVGGNEVVLQICKALHADSYLSGSGGKDYLELDKFQEAGIDVIFNDPHYPKLSSLDWLFRNGNNNIFQWISQ